MAGLCDVQVTVVGPVLPSLKVPVAVNCTVHEMPGTGAEHGEIEAADGVTLMDVRVGSMKNPLQPTTSSDAVPNNATIARVTHSRLDRPRLAIPKASQKQSYQTCIPAEEV
jgi:hypothetical protein